MAEGELLKMMKGKQQEKAKPKEDKTKKRAEKPKKELNSSKIEIDHKVLPYLEELADRVVDDLIYTENIRESIGRVLNSENIKDKNKRRKYFKMIGSLLGKRAGKKSKQFKEDELMKDFYKELHKEQAQKIIDKEEKRAGQTYEQSDLV